MRSGAGSASAMNRKPKRATRRSLATAQTIRNVLYKAIELKNFDQDNGGNIVAAQIIATVRTLNVGIIQGTTPLTHIGRKVMMKSITLRWQGSLAPTTTGSSPLRIVIIYDKQANGALPATTDVFATDVINCFQNLDNSFRFVVLVDRIIPCVGTQGPQAFMLNIHKEINLPLEFKGNAGTVADIATGTLIAYIWQNGSLAVANATDDLNHRVRFTDA